MKVTFRTQVFNEDGEVPIKDAIGIEFINYSDANIYINNFPLPPNSSWSPDFNRGEINNQNWNLRFDSSATTKSFWVITKTGKA